MLAYIRKVADVRRDEGASAVEYGLLVAAIAALVVIIVFSLGTLVRDVFKDTCDDIKQEVGGNVTTNETCNEN